MLEQRESTKNNSVMETLMIEDVTTDNLTDESRNIVEENSLKYTCNDCMFVTTSKTNINEHVRISHSPDKDEEVSCPTKEPCGTRTIGNKEN